MPKGVNSLSRTPEGQGTLGSSPGGWPLPEASEHVGAERGRGLGIVGSWMPPRSLSSWG